MKRAFGSLRKENGITLVTLIVTVIILLILSTVVIDFIIDGSIKDRVDGLIGRADNQQSLMGDIRNEVREQIIPGQTDTTPEEDSEVIPIATVEDLFKVGTGEYIISGEKTYQCTPSANYKLVNTIEFAVNDYKSEYSSLFETTTETTTETVTETFTNEATDYDTANSTEEPYSTYTAKGTGTYKLEVWGAQGGAYNSSYATGGKGGYSVGTITLNEGDKLYVYVGGKGSYGTTSAVGTSGGYNGGGAAAYKGGTGGGATDIRFTSGTWSDSTSLLSRVIVAGGGGGARTLDSQYKATGGYGGGTSGGDGSCYSSLFSGYRGGGASQTAGGTAGTGSSADYNGKAGSFGTGGNSAKIYSSLTTFPHSNGAGRRRLVWWRRSWKLRRKFL